MVKTRVLFFLFLVMNFGYGQETELPGDFRQHNITQFNTGLFHPAFSLQNKATQSVSVWSRWQWQAIDADPTTLFVNYTRLLDNKSVAGVSFFQHNTGLFLNTGGALNYAYSFVLNSNSSLDIGANLFAFKQKLADNRFQQDPQIQIPQFGSTNDFVIQFAPGIVYRTGALSLGLLTENLIDYNFRSKQRNSYPRDRVYLGLLSYNFPMEFLNFEEVSLSPTIYYKAVEGNDSQIGLNALFSTNKFWAQSGYNNFYGISVGGGGTLFEKLSIGALIEFATDNNLKGVGSTFEIVTAYRFGKPYERYEEINEIEIEEGKGLEQEKEFKNEKDLEKEKELEQEKELNEEQKLKKEIALEKEKELEQEKKVIEKQLKEEKRLIEKRVKEEARKNKPKRDNESKNGKGLKQEIMIFDASDVRSNQSKKQAVGFEEQEGLDGQKDLEKTQRRIKDSLDLIKRNQDTSLQTQQKAQEQQRQQDSINEVRSAQALAEKQRLDQQQKLDSVANAKEAKDLVERQRKQDAIDEAKKAQAFAEKQREDVKRKQDSTNLARETQALAEKQRLEHQRMQDSIKKAGEVAALANAKRIKAKREIDSLTQIRMAEAEAAKKVAEEKTVKEEQVAQEDLTDKPQEDEKYEEVNTEDGLEPGYYLIANVFGTKKYFEAFMKDLTDKGLQPKTFFRSHNKYNYVYLKRYDTMTEARIARDGNYDGRYPDKTWIFRVVG